MSPSVAVAAGAIAVGVLAVLLRRRYRHRALLRAHSEEGVDPSVATWLALPEPPKTMHDASAAAGIIEMLCRPKSRISQVHLYDAEGSRLYDEICKTPECARPPCGLELRAAPFHLPAHEPSGSSRAVKDYLTSKEAELLTSTAEDIASTGAAASLQVVVELGAGDGHKTMVLLERLCAQAARTIYAPIDVSREALESNVAVRQSRGVRKAKAWMAKLETRPLLGTFEDCLPRAAALGGSRIYLFLGSSLGNFSENEAVGLLSTVARAMGPSDRFLIGVDLPHSARKPAKVIEAAYNDARGVTAAFTLNALRHVNGLASLDFNWRDGWRHDAVYSMSERGVVTHVQAVGIQTVSSADGAFSRTYADGERIFVEQSRKFDLDDISRIGSHARLRVSASWTSHDGYHLIVDLRPRPPTLPPRLRTSLPACVGGLSAAATTAHAAIFSTSTPTHSAPIPQSAPPSAPHILESALLLSSLTAHTGNAVTSSRIQAAVPATRVSCVDVGCIGGRAELAAHLVASGATLALGVHAYRSGRLLLECGVPFIIVLGGTDMNENLAQKDKGAVIRQVVAQAAAIISFDTNLLGRLLAALPAASPKCFLIPQVRVKGEG